MENFLSVNGLQIINWLLLINFQTCFLRCILALNKQAGFMLYAIYPVINIFKSNTATKNINHHKT